jgi:hypothetical protein
MEGVIAEQDAIMREVGLLRQLVEKSAAVRDGEREEGGFDAGVSVGGVGGEDDDDMRSLCTTVPHGVEEDDEEQIAKHEHEHYEEEEDEEEEERRRRHVELDCPPVFAQGMT